MRKANIISIRTNKEYLSLAYKRVGLGTFYYYLYDINSARKKRSENTNNCNLYFYKENIVFTYGSGVFGSTCTSHFKSEDINI